MQCKTALRIPYICTRKCKNQKPVSIEYINSILQFQKKSFLNNIIVNLAFRRKGKFQVNMLAGKEKYFITFILSFFISTLLLAQNTPKERNMETLQKEVQVLKKYFYEGKNWHIAQPSVEKDVKGLINFVEDRPIDSIIGNINSTFNTSEHYVIRLPENVSDSLNVAGYYANSFVKADIDAISARLKEVYRKKKIVVPGELISNLDERLNLIPEGSGLKLFADSVYSMPDSLQIPEVIPDSVLNSPELFRELVRKDSIRNIYVEKKKVGI